MQSITQDYPWKKVRSCPFTPGWRNTAQHSTDSTAQTAQHSYIRLSLQKSALVIFRDIWEKKKPFICRKFEALHASNLRPMKGSFPRRL